MVASKWAVIALPMAMPIQPLMHPSTPSTVCDPIGQP